MRTFFLFIAGWISLVGCQTVRPASAPLQSAAIPERLPAPAVAPVPSPASEVKPVAFDEPVTSPKPEPETLPHAALRPGRDGELTLSDLEQMALSANPSMARAVAVVEAARGNWVQVGLPFNPSVGYESQQIGSGGLAEQDGVFVSQEFIRGGKLRLNRQVAAQEIAKAESMLAAQQQRVLTDVRIAFYQVLIAERQTKLTNDLRGIASQNVETIEALMRGQEVGKVDLVQAQIELENANILVQNANNRARAAWQTLVTIVGNPTLEPQPLSGDVEADTPPQGMQAALERLLSISPEIAAAQAELDRARWTAERARAEPTPNVTVQGLVNWRDEGIGGKPDGSISVGVPLPLWNRNQGAVIQADQQVVAAQRALEQVELALQNRLAPVYERYANAHNQVETFRNRILPAAQESLDLMRRSYQAGEAGYINLLTAQRTFSEMNLNYLEALRELRAAETEIGGLLLSGSLENK